MIPRDGAIDASWATEQKYYKAPTGNVAPYDYQFAGVEYALGRSHCLIGDAPGLGKTGQSILVSNAIGARRTLVVCPASLRLNWQREIYQWSSTEDVTTYPILKSKDGVSLEANYVIVSYDLLRNASIMDAIREVRWDHLVCDEAHYLKDPRGNRRTEALMGPEGVASVADRITLASGTILPNQPDECYRAIRLLNWEAIDRASLEDFRSAYYTFGEGWVTGPVEKIDKRTGFPCIVYEPHWSDHVRNVPTNLEDLQYRLRKHIMVRRLKDQVLTQLPPKQWHVFPVEINPQMRKVMKSEAWARAERMYQMDPNSFDRGAPIDGAISTAWKEMGEAKAPLVAAYIEDLLASGVHKVVVSAWHITVLEYLRERLDEYGVCYMDGRTSAAKKQQQVDLFQQGEPRIMLGQMLPLGEGWTLTAAQDVVNAEPMSVPSKNEQLLDRCHRPGQEGDYVLGHMPVAVGTLEERFLGNAIVKDQSIFASLDSQRPAGY